MTTPTLKDRKGLPIAKEAIDGFASTLAGKAIRPGDADYEQARRIWNASIDRHPGLIVRVRGTADVVETIRFARAKQNPTALLLWRIVATLTRSSVNRPYWSPKRVGAGSHSARSSSFARNSTTSASTSSGETTDATIAARWNVSGWKS